MFSASPTRVDDVKAYIEGQVEHHRKQTFQDEIRAFLNRYGIEHNEEYIWD